MDKTIALGWGLAGLFLGILLWPYVSQKIKIEVEPQQHADDSKEIAGQFTPHKPNLQIVS